MTIFRVCASAVGLLAALAVSACSTIRSERVDYKLTETGKAFNKDAKGLTYFLPMRLIKVTATRTPVKLADLNKTLAAKQKARSEADEQEKQADATVKALRALINALPTNSAARPVEQAKLDKAIAEQKLAAQAAETLKQDVETVSAYIKQAQNGAECLYTLKLDLLAPHPDASARFTARLSHNIFRDDSTKLAVTPAGLLTSANAVAADRTADILVDLAGAGAALGGGGGPKVMENTAPRKDSDCAKALPAMAATIDPLSGLGDVNTALAKAGFPFVIEGGADIRSALNKNALPSPLPPTDTENVTGGRLYYRTPAPFFLSVRQCKTGQTCNGAADDSQPIDAVGFLLPQAGPVSYIPVNSSVFVKTTDDIQFEDGVLKSWNADRPSEALEIVRLPVKVLTAIVSVPAQLFSVRVDYSTKAKTLLEAQQGQMKAEESMRTLKICIEKAEAALAPATDCFK